MSHRTFSLATLGCKTNQYESQAIRELLLAEGYVETRFGEPCDVAVINTCMVTDDACRKSRKHIHRAAKVSSKTTILVTGCLAELEAEKLRAMPGVTHVIPKVQASRIAQILRGRRRPSVAVTEGRGRGEKVEDGPVFDLAISAFEGHTRAFLKIEDGCESFCSYCVVPSARGRVQSRDAREIRCEAERLIAAGFKEIVLTGIHLGMYGKDLASRTRLEDVVENLLALRGLERLRLSSLEVGEVSDRIIGLMASEPRLCPHLHIPLQSGDDLILSAMRRRYTSADYLNTLERVRAKVTEPSFTTDVLVGFPGESEAQYANTLEVCRKAGFARTHVFRFSPRPGTLAASLPDRVPDAVAREREHRAKDLARELALTYKRKFLGRIVHPLVEHGRDPKTGALCGYTERYLQVLFGGPDELKNRIVPVKAQSCDSGVIRGCSPD